MRFTDDHERAKVIAALRLSGDGSADERAWLERHLSECPACAEVTAGLEHGMALLRSISPPANPGLVAATQRLLREAALRREEEESRRRWLALSTLVAMSMTAAAGVSLWLILGWVRPHLTVAPVTLAPALLALWFLPGILAGTAAWASQGPGGRWSRGDRVFEQGRGVSR